MSDSTYIKVGGGDLGIIVARPCSWVEVLAYRGIPFVLVWLHDRDLDVLRIHHSVVVGVVVAGQNHTDRVQRQDTSVHQDKPVGIVRLWRMPVEERIVRE
jgi:hypothetical protein